MKGIRRKREGGDDEDGVKRTAARYCAEMLYAEVLQLSALTSFASAVLHTATN